MSHLPSSVPRLPSQDFRARELIYDWNIVGQPAISGRTIALNDETLRDGLQSPSVLTPRIEQKIELLELMDVLGIHGADIGFAGSSAQSQEDIVALAQASARLNIRP